ncbi:ipis-1-like [Haemaphysalis longicornis]
MYRRSKPFNRRLPGDEEEGSSAQEPSERQPTASRLRPYSSMHEEYSSEDTEDSGYHRLFMAGVSRATDSAGTPQCDSAVIRHGIAQFTVDFMRFLVERRPAKSSNVVFSPLALETTLALMFSAAQGETASQIASAMNIKCAPLDLQAHVFRHIYQLPTRRRHYYTLNNRIQLRARPPDSAATGGLMALARTFNVDLKYVNFSEDAEGVRNRTNEWLHYLSAFECDDVFPEGSVSDSSSLVLASLTYLRADWKWQFRLQDTAPGPFYTSPYYPRTVLAMKQSGRFPMANFDDIDARALELKYRRKDRSMIIFLPRKLGGLAQLEQCLTPTHLLQCLDESWEERDVVVTLPRFCAKQIVNLAEILPDFGIKDLFSGMADLSAIAGMEGYHLSQGEGEPMKAMHCAAVCVKEKGQKLLTPEKSGEQENAVFAVDRPFMFVMVRRDPQGVLLLGSVRDIRLPYI